jgi:hypothetical protein
MFQIFKKPLKNKFEHQLPEGVIHYYSQNNFLCFISGKNGKWDSNLYKKCMLQE